MIFQALSENYPSTNVRSLCVLFWHFVTGKKNQIEHYFGYCRETETIMNCSCTFFQEMLHSLIFRNSFHVVFKGSFSLL